MESKKEKSSITTTTNGFIYIMCSYILGRKWQEPHHFHLLKLHSHS